MRLRVPALKGDHALALIKRRRGAPHEFVEEDEDDRGLFGKVKDIFG